MAKLKTGRHTSALKATRQAEKHRWVNHAAKEKAKTVTKQLLAAIQSKDATKSRELLRETMSVWTRIARKNVVTKAAASRKIARLSSRVQSLG